MGQKYLLVTAPGRGYSGGGKASLFGFWPLAGNWPLAAISAFVVRATMRASYTLSNLLVTVSSNPLTTMDVDVRFIVNGSPGNQSVTIPFGATGTFEDTTNSDSLADGDTAYTDVTAGNEPAVIELEVCSYILDSGGIQDYFTICAKEYDTQQAANATTYSTLFGTSRFGSTEADTQYIFRQSITYRNLYCYVYYNDLQGASTLRSRKNGANGNQSVSIASGATGAFEDTVNTDDYVAGDTGNYQAVVGGMSGRFIAISLVSMHGTSAARNSAYGDVTGLTIGWGLTEFVALESGQGTTEATESPAQCKARGQFIARNLFCRVIANNLDEATTIALRKDGSSMDAVVTVGAGATGTFEETASITKTNPGSLLCYLVDTEGSTAGLLTITLLGVE
ncbi:hypothetical protein LCGC14_1860840, partial [marine sediment metagenome]